MGQGAYTLVHMLGWCFRHYIRPQLHPTPGGTSPGAPRVPNTLSIQRSRRDCSGAAAAAASINHQLDDRLQQYQMYRVACLWCPGTSSLSNGAGRHFGLPSPSHVLPSLPTSGNTAADHPLQQSNSPGPGAHLPSVPSATAPLLPPCAAPWPAHGRLACPSPRLAAHTEHRSQVW
jgi:hypothetical protein